MFSVLYLLTFVFNIPSSVFSPLYYALSCLLFSVYFPLCQVFFLFFILLFHRKSSSAFSLFPSAFGYLPSDFSLSPSVFSMQSSFYFSVVIYYFHAYFFCPQFSFFYSQSSDVSFLSSVSMQSHFFFPLSQVSVLLSFFHCPVLILHFQSSFFCSQSFF